VLLLAVVGGAAGFAERRLIRFLAWYTLLSAAAFSAIPYKTPWNLLPFHAGAVLLAGYGAESSIRAAARRRLTIAAATLMGAGVVFLGVQSCRASYTLAADPGNPYAYAQTSTDFMKLVGRIRGLASRHPDGKRMPVFVCSDPGETWPLPWYLRDFARVGYWRHAADAGNLRNAPVVIASLDQEERVSEALGDEYLYELYSLREGVFLALFIQD